MFSGWMEDCLIYATLSSFKKKQQVTMFESVLFAFMQIYKSRQHFQPENINTQHRQNLAVPTGISNN